MKEFKLSFCLSDSEYFTALRLAVGGVCAAADLDIDASEDFKVSVTESCLILKGCGYGSAVITLSAGDGLSAEIRGEDAGTLSGGEKRRLSVASALVARPRILVLDEPTFGQDSRTWAELVRLLAEQLDRGTAVIAVTHDRAFIDALADQEIVVAGRR